MGNQPKVIPRDLAESINPLITGDTPTTLAAAQTVIGVVQDYVLHTEHKENIEYGGIWSILESVYHALEYEVLAAIEEKS